MQPDTFIEAFNWFCTEQHERMKKQGFWGAIDNPETCPTCNITTPAPNVGEKLMLIVSEAAELFEAHRKGKVDAPCDKMATVIDPNGSMTIPCKACDGAGSAPDRLSRDIICIECKGLKKVTITGVRRLTYTEEELSDIIIRVADYAGFKGINLGAAILSKMQYNATREKMHGKLC